MPWVWFGAASFSSQKALNLTRNKVLKENRHHRNFNQEKMREVQRKLFCGWNAKSKDNFLALTFSPPGFDFDWKHQSFQCGSTGTDFGALPLASPFMAVRWGWVSSQKFCSTLWSLGGEKSPDVRSCTRNTGVSPSQMEGLPCPWMKHLSFHG